MTGEDILRPLDKSYDFNGQGGGEFAYRNIADCPPTYAGEGALWPPKPKWHWSATMWAKEKWWTLRRHHDQAEAYRATRTLWRRHPWLRTGEVWWRPWWSPQYLGPTGRHEFIDPANGLHRWNIDGRGEAWEFDGDIYDDTVRARRKGLPPPMRAKMVERDVLSLSPGGR